jgi:RNA polymerase sigma factor (sigma-70 family)
MAAQRALSSLIDFVRRLASKSTGPDADLLRRFLSQRDQAAFLALVERHGPMVLGVCRRLLRHEQDAEDAFQATFLVLARQATRVSRPELLAAWLYRVAYRVALRARAGAARRRTEVAMGDIAAPDTSQAADWAELRPLLDAEIERLAEKYRTPFVLCYLSGATNEQAAALLGCPTGTIASRLATARERLRSRLQRRGITLSATAVAALVTEHASAAVPPALASATSQSVAGAVSAHVLVLTEGVLQSMLLGNLVRMTCVVLAVGILAGTGLVLSAWQVSAFDAQAQGPVRQPQPAPPAADPAQKQKGVWRVEDVLNAYVENDALADENFTGKRVRVEGTVVQVKRSKDGYILTLTQLQQAEGGIGGPPMVPGTPGTLPGGFAPGMPGPAFGAMGAAEPWTLSFAFPKEQRGELAKLRARQQVTIEGLCDGVSDSAAPPGSPPRAGGPGAGYAAPAPGRITFTDCKLIAVRPRPGDDAEH